MGYRYLNTFPPKAVAYPFGFGLSYPTFDFNVMKFDSAGEGWVVTGLVTKTGKTRGKVVVQLVVRAPRGKLDKPARELKGFAKTPELAPGERFEVKRHVPAGRRASYDEQTGSWVIEPGKYVFMASKDASDCSLKKSVNVAGSGAVL